MADDLAGLIAVSTSVTASLAALVLIAGSVSGLVALGLMQTEVRHALQRRAFFMFFRQSQYGGARGNGSLLELIDGRGPWLFGLHYRQLAGQLLAMATSDAQRTRPGRGGLVEDILWLKEPRTLEREHDPDGHVEAEDRLDKAARWIDLLQGELGRAVTGAVLRYTFGVWAAFLLMIAVASVARSQSIRTLGEVHSFLQAVGVAISIVSFVFVAAVSICFVASAVAAAALFVFTLLDRITGTR